MQDSVKAKYTQMIKEEAQRLGFSFCGISRAEFLEEEAPLLERWLHQGRHGKMQYMENYFDMRLDPRKLVDGAKSRTRRSNAFAIRGVPRLRLAIS